MATHHKMQRYAEELQAEADSLPEGHPKKEKLLYHADIALHSAERHEERERFAPSEE
jgi:hypothetical protein